MTLLSSLRSIYSLDTLDTRFINSPKVPYKAVIDARNGHGTSPVQDPPVRLDSRQQQIVPNKSLWKTPEFYFYYFIFIITVPYMFWIVYDVSRTTDPLYAKYEHLLSPGWIPGRKVDVSDAQYRTFRENIPYMLLLLVLHPTLRRVYEKLRPITTKSKAGFTINGKSGRATTAEGEARLEQRASYDFGFALVFLSALHGFSMFKIVAILYLNYGIATKLPRKYIVAATWAFNICILFANELNEGYKFEKIERFISHHLGISNVEGAEAGVSWGHWLDSYGGIMSRWEVLFNITVLRLISFNVDYYWQLDRRAGSPLEKQLDPSNLSENDRVRTPPPASAYNFRNYLAYAIYAPLYLAGPILTFNDYIWQCSYATPSIETSRTTKYGIRFLGTLLCMELILHFNYCVAISHGSPDWSDYTPAQLSLMSYFNLHVTWLKLLLPWRLFRLWSLVDGIDPPENMLRCLSDNPSTVAFWRSWHRSYNKWLLRYLYIPLGGSSTRGRFGVARAILNYLTVFTFVALWHDISLNLLIWGWLIVFFMLPEVIAGQLFPRKRWEKNLTAWRWLCCIGGVGNLLMMMIANMVGFAVGVDGLKSIVAGIFRDWSGLAFLVTACSALFVGVNVMFEVREDEMRRGIYLKC